MPIVMGFKQGAQLFRNKEHGNVDRNLSDIELINCEKAGSGQISLSLSLNSCGSFHPSNILSLPSNDRNI